MHGSFAEVLEALPAAQHQLRVLKAPQWPQVVLTDCEEAVLLNLRECAAANASADKENRHALPSATAASFPSQVCLLLAQM